MTEGVYKLNLPPEDFVRVQHGDMQGFVAAVARASGLVADRADLLGELLTGNDLRGVFSHGTRQVARYARTMRDGDLNVKPDVKVLQEGPTSVVMDGDGGLGYFPMYDGTLRGDREGEGAGRGRPADEEPRPHRRSRHLRSHDCGAHDGGIRDGGR